MMLFDFVLTTVVLNNIIELTMASSHVKIVNEILKVKLCHRNGTVESLKAFKNDELQNTHCEVFNFFPNRGLRLSWLGISEFSNNWFAVNSSDDTYSTYYLNLDDNNIVDVRSEILNNLPDYIHSVSLDRNKIERLGKGMIVNMHLQLLFLDSNSISEIGEGTFESTTLRYLSLSNNRLTNTRFIATLPSNLTKLLLNDNEIENISGSFFSRLNKLDTLNLAGNNITALENSSRLQLPSLWTLNLERNNLMKIEPGSFQDLGGLRLLLLGRNNLSVLDKDVFSGLKNIDAIDLDRNKLLTIANGCLRGLSKTLTALILSSNRIETLQNGTFSAVPTALLSLKGNQIKTIEKGSFNLPDLWTLDLSNNSWSKPNSESFVGLANLRYVLLKNNGITKIDKDFLKTNLPNRIQMDI